MRNIQQAIPETVTVYVCQDSDGIIRFRNQRSAPKHLTYLGHKTFNTNELEKEEYESGQAEN